MDLQSGHCHVWMATAEQGSFCGVAFGRGQGHVDVGLDVIAENIGLFGVT
jgi:hypothetical protein